ncbi:hypothetical protein KUV22_16675 [Microbulbifer agarilyticus]|uniref:MaoC family dehydratase n=1 Tax=Microbulbifer agarilyticus TaxID=260552 RepID=UPI001C9821B9|nr:MaoC/PaaZ C-terminal domain-containing protein [Microbulbifer agarilyticus]MBY6192061.1 hypothetical protein [Microbulbifer agarilyticus]
MPRFIPVPKANHRSSPLHIELNARPAVLPLYFRALTARKKRTTQAHNSSVLASVSLREQRVDRERVRAYCDVCGFAAGTDLPATYPFVLAMPLHLKLLVSDAFTFPVLGMVHLRNQITQHRPIQVEEPMDIHCDLLAPVPVKRGYEFALVTRVKVGDELVWECESAMLVRGKHADKDAPKHANLAPFPQDMPDMAEASSIPWSISEAAGRSYAKVSGDWNPIHLFASSARLFGFSSAIVHGMWTKAACLAALESEAGERGLPAAFRMSVEFKRPVLLPASAQFLYTRGDGGTGFRVQDQSGKTLYLNGQLQPL